MAEGPKLGELDALVESHWRPLNSKTATRNVLLEGK